MERRGGIGTTFERGPNGLRIIEDEELNPENPRHRPQIRWDELVEAVLEGGVNHISFGSPKKPEENKQPWNKLSIPTGKQPAIPLKGPGRYSMRNALAKGPQFAKNSTLQERRRWNADHQLNPYCRR